jgi:hypothetical protein
MIPKLVFTTFFLALLSLCQAQETTHLSGEITVQLKKKEFTANYALTNITVNSPKMSFMLHEDLDINQVYLNGDPIASSKNGRFCETCKVHTIWIDRPLTTQDTVKITVEGSLENFSGKDVINRKQLFEAGSPSKWYPVILDEKAKESGAPFASNNYAYTYDLKVKCGDCMTLNINSLSSDNNIFHSDTPTENILLTLSTKRMEQQTNIPTVKSADIVSSQNN